MKKLEKIAEARKMSIDEVVNDFISSVLTPNRRERLKGDDFLDLGVLTPDE